MKLQVSIEDVDLVIDSEIGLDGWAFARTATDKASAEDYLADGFGDLAGDTFAGELITLSRWAPLAREFGWPESARTCSCLREPDLAQTAAALSGATLIDTPGPVFNRFLIRTTAVERMIARDSRHVSMRTWADIIGLGRSAFAPGFVDLSPEPEEFRRVLLSRQSGDAHESFLRAFDSYIWGGMPRQVGEMNRRALIGHLEARLGFDYNPDETRVYRRVFMMNAIHMESSWCCTSIVDSGTPQFVTGLERAALQSRAT